MNQINLKPINSTQVRIPEQLDVLVGNQIDVIVFPFYGTLQDKKVYLEIARLLNIVEASDESIIR